jgi:hypothetical protein
MRSLVVLKAASVASCFVSQCEGAATIGSVGTLHVLFVN